MRLLALFVFSASSVFASGIYERHMVVHEWLYPGLRGVTIRDGVITEWPKGAPPRPTDKEIDDAIPAWRVWRKARDLKAARIEAARELVILKMMRSEDPSLVTTEEVDEAESKLDATRAGEEKDEP